MTSNIDDKVDAVDLIVAAFRDFAKRIRDGGEATFPETRIAKLADDLADDWEQLRARLATMPDDQLAKIAGKKK